MAGGESSQLTSREAAAMARCGVSLIGFDQLTPEDPRLAAIVWSWAPGEPSSNGNCAASAPDTRFHAVDCAQKHAFVCMLNPDQWRVTATQGPFRGGATACAKQFPGSSFAVPANGWENALMRAAAGGNTVWLNYSNWR
jgi:hypothetical protein